MEWIQVAPKKQREPYHVHQYDFLQIALNALHSLRFRRCNNQPVRPQQWQSLH